LIHAPLGSSSLEIKIVKYKNNERSGVFYLMQVT
jgi:hypothetical protein